MATRYFFTGHCQRIIRAGEKDIEFKPLSNAGSWTGTYETEEAAVADALLDARAVEEITAERYAELWKGPPPVSQPDIIRLGQNELTQLASQQVKGEDGVKLDMKALGIEPAAKPETPAVVDVQVEPVETYEAKVEAVTRRRGRPPKTL